MNLTVGYIPYLNMVPFHVGFGPATVERAGVRFQFQSISPRGLGLQAEAGQIDAGAMSLLDTFRLSEQFENLGDFGIGVKRSVKSVLLFSKRPIQEMSGICAVTDETVTSIRLLQVLLEKRHQRSGITYGRIASGLLFDGSAQGLLLIGDEALRARRHGIKGLPFVTDLAEEWYRWQKAPFVFARWAVRRSVPSHAKVILKDFLRNSLESLYLGMSAHARTEAGLRSLSASEVEAYWDDFCFRLTPEHELSIQRFKELQFAATPLAGEEGDRER
jgi:chorismate dehydratase